jgi:hypothetical protein
MKVSRIKIESVCVELTEDECIALVQVLSEVSGKMLDRTFEVYNKLDDIVYGERDEESE